MERKAQEMATMNSRIAGWIVGVAVVWAVAAASLCQAVDVTFVPGTYGSYYSGGVLNQPGTYGVRQGGSWALWDTNGNRTVSLTTDGTYEVMARDANVVIGSFDVTGGGTAIANPLGSITVTGTQVDFVNQSVSLSGAPGWLSCANLWNLSWGAKGLARFDLPAGTWGGWYGQLSDGNSYAITVAADGVVTVNSDARGIGITGGANQLVFPSEVTPVTYTVTGDPAWWNWLSLDWATYNLPTSGTSTLYLYPGQYSPAAGFGTWSPALSDFTVPMTRGPWSVSFTNTDTGLTIRFEDTIPEPGTALVLGLGALALRRRRAA